MLLGTLVFTGTTSVMAYDVKKGDTLYKIAVSHDMPLSQVVELNPQISNVNLIFVGETVRTNANEKQHVKPVKKAALSPSPSTQKSVKGFSQSELDLFARVVSAEARDESFKGKVAVAEVIINRINSSQFPDTVSSVVYQKGQFSVISNGSANKAPTKDSYTAIAEAVTSSSDITGGALFFYNPRLATSRWLDSKTTTLVLGGHSFKK